MRKIPKIKMSTLTGRVNRAVSRKREILEAGVDHFTPQIMPGNSKTGPNCYTVSLICGHDCPQCKFCFKDCYDCRNVLWRPDVIETRAINSAIHMADPERYFWEIAAACENRMIRELRFNVGGDFSGHDFMFLDQSMKKCRGTESLFFTHNKDEVNAYLDKVGKFSKNVHALISISRGQEETWDNSVDNRHNLPLAHIRYEDGSCPTLDAIRPKPSAVFSCGGNCSRCFWERRGCPFLKRGQHMVFDYH